jgi:hypothetical protein
MNPALCGALAAAPKRKAGALVLLLLTPQGGVNLARAGPRKCDITCVTSLRVSGSMKLGGERSLAAVLTVFSCLVLGAHVLRADLVPATVVCVALPGSPAR